MKRRLGKRPRREASKRLRRSRAATDSSSSDRTEASPAGSLSYFGLNGEFITSAPNHEVAKSEILRRERYPMRRRVHIQPLRAPGHPDADDEGTRFQAVIAPLTVTWSIKTKEDERLHGDESVILEEDFEFAEDKMNGKTGRDAADREVLICQIAGARAVGRDISARYRGVSQVDMWYNLRMAYVYHPDTDQLDEGANLTDLEVIDGPRMYGELKASAWGEDDTDDLATGKVLLPYWERAGEPRP
jgi:hypothetical protein